MIFTISWYRSRWVESRKQALLTYTFTKASALLELYRRSVSSRGGRGSRTNGTERNEREGRLLSRPAFRESCIPTPARAHFSITLSWLAVSLTNDNSRSNFGCFSCGNLLPNHPSWSFPTFYNKSMGITSCKNEFYFRAGRIGHSAQALCDASMPVVHSAFNFEQNTIFCNVFLNIRLFERISG